VRSSRLAAFVDGFAWLSGALEAVVWYDPRRAPRGRERLAELKVAAETRIRAGDLGMDEVLPGFFCIANA
jgi:hypothetical protein